MSTKGKVVVAILIAVLGVGTLGYWTHINRNQSKGSSGLVRDVERSKHPVKVFEVTRADIVDKLNATGEVKAARDVTLVSEVPGEVLKVFKDLGDTCKKNELLIRLDKETFAIALEQAKAMEEQSQVALDHAGRDLKRIEKLQASAVATEQQVDQAERVKSSSQAAFKQSKAALKAARKNLRDTEIRCPFTGLVAQMNVDKGQMAAVHMPLARLVDTSKLTLTLSVSGSELRKLKVGAVVDVFDPAFPDDVEKGTVVRLGVAADERTRMFPVEIELGGDDSKIKAGQLVEASVETGRFEQTLFVPRAAVFDYEGQPHVYVVEGDTVKRWPLNLGQRVGDVHVIDGELDEGARVVVVGRSELKDGMLVEIIATVER